MAQKRQRALAALLLAAGLLPANTADAGPILAWLCGDCPPPEYSPFRYWAPGMARIADDVHGPRLSVYAPDRHPEVPPTNIILKFPCPPVAPAVTIITPPTPPAASRFRY